MKGNERIMKLLSLPEAAERLGLSHWTVRRLAAAGQIDSVRIGRRRLIPEEAVNNLIINGLRESRDKLARASGNNIEVEE